MKNYDYLKAEQIIEKEKEAGALSAELYMDGDYFWTAEEVWNKAEGFLVDLKDSQLTIGGIRGSQWATPMLKIIFEDYDKTFECHDNGSSDYTKKPLWI